MGFVDFGSGEFGGQWIRGTVSDGVTEVDRREVEDCLWEAGLGVRRCWSGCESGSGHQLTIRLRGLRREKPWFLWYRQQIGCRLCRRCVLRCRGVSFAVLRLSV